MIFDETKNVRSGTVVTGYLPLPDLVAPTVPSGVAELDVAYQRLLAALQITMDAARAGDAEKYQAARAYVDQLHAQLHAEKADLLREELDAEELDE